MLQRLFALFALAIVLTDCRREEQKVGHEAPLVMVLSPTHGADATRVKELQAMLERESGLRVELRVAPSAEAAVRMAGSPNTDAALLTVFEYLFCRQLHGVTAGLKVVRTGGAVSHHGEIVALKSRGAKSLSDLEGKRIAYVDRYSSTGYILPAKLLADAKVGATPVFAGTHQAAISELKAGRTDAAATYADAVTGDPELTVLAKTQDMPNEPVFFRASLDKDKRDKLVAALEKVARSDEGRRVLGGMANLEGFVPATDAEYIATADLVTSIGKSVKDVVPRGWTLSNEAERRPADLAP